jgi:hypothetical protein
VVALRELLFEHREALLKVGGHLAFELRKASLQREVLLEQATVFSLEEEGGGAERLGVLLARQVNHARTGKVTALSCREEGRTFSATP